MSDVGDGWDDWDEPPPGPSDQEVRIPTTAVTRGQSTLFSFQRLGAEMTGFIVVASDGTPRAYVNVCPHVPYRLDAGDGELLMPDRVTLLCVHHGSRFDGETGQCTRGPAHGRGLERLPVVRDGDAWVVTVTPSTETHDVAKACPTLAVFKR